MHATPALNAARTAALPVMPCNALGVWRAAAGAVARGHHKVVGAGELAVAPVALELDALELCDVC